jgi:hypothetical protein
VKSESAKDLAACQKTHMLQQVRFNIGRHLPLEASLHKDVSMASSDGGKPQLQTAFAKRISEEFNVH